MRVLRRLAGLAAFVAVAAAAAVVLRRRTAGSKERVDLYYEDGSMTSFEEGSPESAPLLGLARDALDAARAG